MKRNPLLVASLINEKKILFAIFCCVVLMLFSASAWAAVEADPCVAPTIGTAALPVGSATGCGVLITITGTSGNLVATVTGGGTANGNPYDGEDDQLVGIQNNSSVTIGKIILSSPPVTDSSQIPYASNLFAFDGDGPCDYFYLNDEEEEVPTTYDCYNNGVAVGETQADPLDYEGPDNIFEGISQDYTTGTIRFVTPIPPGGSTWFALEDTPATVISIGETQQLVTGVTNVFPFGPITCTTECTYGSGVWTETHTLDAARFTPVSLLTEADYWTVLPVPVCAGPLGEFPFGPFTGTPSFGFTTGDFGLEAPSDCLSYGPPGFVTNFGPTSATFTTFGNLPYPNANSLAIVPYSDYSSLNDPVGIEVERDCIGSDCGSVQWTMELDYNIDAYSIAGPIGGPVICFAPGVPAPLDPSGVAAFSQVGATDCSVNALYSYTGATPTDAPPPPKGGGTDGKSVFASLFSPAQSETDPVPPGVTVGFPGFEFPTSNTSSPSCTPEPAQYLPFPSGKQVTITAPVNCLLKVLGVRVPWPLLWDYTTTANVPITNLQLCLSVTGGTCNTPGVSPPWVYLSLIPVNAICTTGQSPLSGIFTNLNNLKKPLVPLPGQYSFVWEPVNNPTGCEVAPVLQFSNGTIVSPAVFVYSY